MGLNDNKKSDRFDDIIVSVKSSIEASRREVFFDRDNDSLAYKKQDKTVVSLSSSENNSVVFRDSYEELPLIGNPSLIYVTRDSGSSYYYDGAIGTYRLLNDPDSVNPDAPDESQVYYVRLATTGPLANCTYYNGVGNDGVGATLTGTGPLGQSNSPGLVDTKAPVASNVILVKDESSKLRNGLYEVTQLNPFILTRIDGYNETSEVYPSIVFVSDGRLNINRYFSQSTANPTIGFNSLVYAVATVNQPASPVLFVDAVFTSNLTATYTSGTVYPVTLPGFGAKLTGTGPIGTSNGVTLKSNDKVVVNGQTNPAHNGSYVVTNAGSGTQNWVLTRSSADSSAFYSIREYVVNNPNSTIFGSRWTISSPLTMLNSAWGTTGITFTQNNAGGGGSDYLYAETTISASQLQNINLAFPEILPSLADFTENTYYEVGMMIIEHQNQTVDYDVTGISALRINCNVGNAKAFIYPTFLTYGGKKALILNFDATNTFNYFGQTFTIHDLNQQSQYTAVILETLPNVAPTLGDGELLIKTYYKIRTFGTEL
jgi:hypothetical protein